MEYKIFAYIGIALIAAYVLLRMLGQWALRKLIRAEYEYVLNSDQFKVKGRFE